MIKLKCDCEITDNGKFIVSQRCENCRECNTVSELHPFGEGRL